jgi:hypothetical protein
VNGQYQVEPTQEYTEELRRIAAGVPYLEQFLDLTVYAALRHDPHQGYLSRRTGLWLIRRQVTYPLLIVQISYRIDEAAKQVSLVSIREVNTTTP